MAEETLEWLTAEVLSSAKYKTIAPDLVRRIGATELGKGRTLKETLKATKNKLHQVGGAYRMGKQDPMRWLQTLREAGEDREILKAACKMVMAAHASTRERLPILESFYAKTLGGLPPIHTVLDVGCGLNPLAIPWMPLAENVHYIACDIYSDMVDFLNKGFPLLGVEGEARVCEVVGAPPDDAVDLALILKTIPILEQVDKEAGERLLDGLNAEYILVSFPVSSLGGREKGMPENYEARFWELVEGRGWEVEKFEFESENAFLIAK